MKKIITFLQSIMIVSFFVSCGGPNKPSVDLSNDSSGKEFVSYEELVLDYVDGSLNNVPGAPISIQTEPEKFAFQPVLIKNDNRIDSLAISVDSSSLDSQNGVEVVNNCPASLARKQFCYIGIYVNRNEAMAASTVLSAANLVLNLDSIDYTISVQAETTSAIDLDSLAETEITVSSNSLDYGNVYENVSKTMLLILKNNSTKRDLPINKDISTLTIADESVSTCAASLPRKSACFIAYTLKDTLAVNTYSEMITIAGENISLSAVIDSQPIQTSNSVVTYNKDPANNYQFNSLASSFVISITNDTGDNEPLFYDFYPNLTSEGVSGIDYPSAFTLRDGCTNKQVLRATTCFLQMEFDPERYHFGVTFSKTISFNDEDMDLSFEGSSPCSNPADPLYQAGTKLSQDKQSCIPNLGVFDSPDSVYGHAVYQ